MKWVTRARPKTDRIACPWLIRRFIDPDAAILYVPTDQVLSAAAAKGARSFDASGAEYTHRDGKCSFEVLIEDFGLGGDPALARLAKIVHGADFPAEMDATRESAGLWAISQGFTDLGMDDAEVLARASFLYDSLYAHMKRLEIEPA